jgi:AcrR family transcriptional regulator
MSMTRAQKSEAVRKALFKAAAEIVGEFGYANASISKITQRANLAQGTFYNYFASRQDLLDQLLIALGADMLAYIHERAVGGKTFLDREERAFRAFFEFLKKNSLFADPERGGNFRAKGLSSASAQCIRNLRKVFAYWSRQRRNC